MLNRVIDRLQAADSTDLRNNKTFILIVDGLHNLRVQGQEIFDDTVTYLGLPLEFWPIMDSFPYVEYLPS